MGDNWYVNKLIQIGYLTLSLGLILSPFFVLRKAKIIKWRSIFLSYFLAIVFFGGVMAFYFWLDGYLYNNVYNSGWTMDAMENATVLLWFILYILASISPFLITKLKYRRLTVKRIVIDIFLATFIGMCLFIAWAYYVAWGLGKVGELYF